MTFFSKGIQYEFSQTSRIDVLDYKPAFVETKLSGQKQSLTCITPEVAARNSLDDLGQTVSTNAVAVHQFMNWTMESLLNKLDYFAKPVFYKAGVKKYDDNKKRN